MKMVEIAAARKEMIPGYLSPKKIVPLEHQCHLVHHLFADKDRGLKENVPHNEQPEDKSCSTLKKIQPGRCFVDLFLFHKYSKVRFFGTILNILMWHIAAEFYYNLPHREIGKVSRQMSVQSPDKDTLIWVP
jgi:hypothetical protein